MPDSRMSHACILAAPSDEECMKMARALAQGILCERGGDEPCGRCEACRKVSADIHPDLITVRRLNDDKGRPRREITVEQIRSVNRDAWVLPNEAARKVYIISEADKMNPAAQNAALKLLEEPPNGAVFLLCASNPSLLLPTVRSRCALRRSPAGETPPARRASGWPGNTSAPPRRATGRSCCAGASRRRGWISARPRISSRRCAFGRRTCSAAGRKGSAWTGCG